jgi:hypothetical protein
MIGGALGLGAVALLVGFPLLLLTAVWGLEALERWMVTPGERAEEVARLLNSEDPETIESAVANLFHAEADRPGRPIRTSLAIRRILSRSRT